MIMHMWPNTIALYFWHPIIETQRKRRYYYSTKDEKKNSNHQNTKKFTLSSSITHNEQRFRIGTVAFSTQTTSFNVGPVLLIFISCSTFHTQNVSIILHCSLRLLRTINVIHFILFCFEIELFTWSQVLFLLISKRHSKCRLL